MQFQSDTQAKQDLGKQNDAQLICKAIRGDQDALEALFTRNNRALYHTALRVLGNPEDAEDALQEGLLSAYRNLRRFEGRAQFSTWLTRIVVNAALMRRRSQRARPAVAFDDLPGEDATPVAERFADAAPNPEQVYAGKELTQLVAEHLENLSPVLRSAFVLREVKGLSTEEAARELGVTENTLKARLWRARQQLATRLEHLRRDLADTVESVAARPAAGANGRYEFGARPCACPAD